MRVAIGCRDHSGWAVLVTVGGTPKRPEIIDRRRVELVNPDLPRMAYHAAEELDAKAATALVRKVERAAATTTRRALRELIAGLPDDARDIAGIAVAVGTSSIPKDMAAILRSHALLHAAEAALYRDALAASGEALGLPLVRFPNKRAITEAAAATGVAPEVLKLSLTQLGKPLGPPWQADHREATAGALLVLASAH